MIQSSQKKLNQYNQVEGVAMGLPYNGFLCHYKKTWLNGYTPQFTSAVCRRYVNDISVLFKSKENLELFVN